MKSSLHTKSRGLTTKQGLKPLKSSLSLSILIELNGGLELFSEYVKNRKLDYAPGIRGDFVQFIQFIHDKVRTGEVKKLSSPLSVYWSITAKCNLSCKHCYAANRAQNSQNDLNILDALKIINILANNNVMEIILQGGEPFCYDNILEIIRSIKTQEMAVSILTNGTLLADDNLQCVNTCLDPLDMVQISLDGSAISNDFIRGEGVFQKVLENIKKISFPNVVVNCVVTSYNLFDLPDLCKILNDETNIRELHFSPLMKMGRGKNLDYPAYESAMEIFLLMKQQSHIKISGSVIPDIILLKEPDKYDIDMTHVKLGCCAGRSKIFIDHLGYMHSCDYRQETVSEKDSLLLCDFRSLWEKSWQSQIEDSYIVSKEMAKSQQVKHFCPSLYEK